MKVSRRASIDRYYLLSLFGYGVFLHHIHHDDPKPVMHSHPWAWFSVIFGRYEETRQGQPTQTRRGFNYCKPGVPHRVTLPYGPVWTLLFHGPRRCRWVVTDLDGNVLEEEPWTGTENAERKSYVRKDNIDV